MRPYALFSLASVVLLAVVGAMQALRLMLIKPIFDKVLQPDSPVDDLLLVKIPQLHRTLDLHFLVPSHFHNAWTIVAYALVLSALVKSVCDYVGTYCVNYAGFGMITDLRNDLYNAVLRRSTAFFQKHTTGTLLSTLINDVERVQTSMSTVLGDALQQVFTFLFTVCAAIYFGGKLAWVLLLFVPVVISSAKRIGRGVRITTRSGQDKLAEIQNILHETITGNAIVKAFGMERWEMTRFRTSARRLLRANLRSASVQAISSPLMDAIGMIGIALLLTIGRDRIKAHEMTAGSFIAFLFTTFSLYDPVRKFAQFYNNFQQGLGASEEIFKFMDAQDDVVEKKNAVVLKGFNDSIRFREVRFSYSEEGEAFEGKPRHVLNGFSLKVKRGDVIALVGPSGAGKSTLVNLIPRFFDVSSGSIEIDGHDLRDVTIESLRKQIGKVTQETVLFNDTVRNNIAYGQPNVPLAKVEEAAKMALAHEFILQMPDGYDTKIGEKGVRLSGGERQRLAIARAILKNAPILILDEATSALDTESESLVGAALGNLMDGRTSFVIAHRLSTVRRATRIVVLEGGMMTEAGTHEELLANSGTYRRLYDMQFGEEPDAATAEASMEGDVMSGVLSMTGFATVDATFEAGRGLSLTMKAVNHRHLDLSLRLPSGMDALEPALRKAVKAAVRRGHVELTLIFEKTSAGAVVELDEVLLEAYVLAFGRAAARFAVADQEPDLNGLLRMPGVMSAAVKSVSAAEVEAPVIAATDVLLERFNAARAAEGDALAADLRAGMVGLGKLADEARTLREGVAAGEFARLKTKMAELLEGSSVSEERLLSEAAMIAGRGDVEEELVRLRTHIERFIEILQGGGEVGRQLDFLLQEMNREANTLLSKSGGNAGGAGMRLSEIGLEMKVGLERAREQVQNLE